MGSLGENDWEKDVQICKKGALALTRRCVKLFWTHGRLFLPILVLIVFPLSVIQEVLSVALAFAEVRGVLGAMIQKEASGSSTNFEVGPGVITSTIAEVLGGGLIDTAVSIVPYICVVYGVASIFSNKTVVFADALAAVRRLWRPVVSTSLCVFAVICGIIAVMGPLMYAAYLFRSVALTLAAVVLVWVLVVCVGFSFQLGLVVPVLEEAHGWNALRKSWRLLQGKKCVAFKILLLYIILIVLALFASDVIWQWIGRTLKLGTPIDAPGKVDFHTVLLSVIEVVIRAAFTSVTTMLGIGLETLLYFSCKALHQESVTDAAVFQNQDLAMQGAYEKVSQQSEYPEV